VQTLREIKCKHKRQVQAVDEQKESKEAECDQSIAHCEATMQSEAKAEAISERKCKQERQIQSTVSTEATIESVATAARTQ
jgi:hypothetical protein